MGKAGGKNGAVVDPVQKESSRLLDIALNRRLLSRGKANPEFQLQPSKALLKCDGCDIVKKGHRKTKYLFSFPGLVAPVSGGKFGDLAHLDTRNPILYVDFPLGRLKFFGTIVYPKNRYLTMQISRGAKGVLCEDSFEALIVFSETWWIGKKEDNPEELKLEMPKDMEQEKHANYEFAANAGCLQSPTPTLGVQRPDKHIVSSSTLTQTTITEFQGPSVPEEQTPIRQSARTCGKKRSYVEVLSDESDDECQGKLENEDPTTSGEADVPVRVNPVASGSRKKTKTMLDYATSVTADTSTTSSATQKKQARIDSLLKAQAPKKL